MEIKQNIAPYSDKVRTIYKQHIKMNDDGYEYQLFQNNNLSKSFGCFDNNELVGFILVSEKTLMNQTNIYKSVLLQAPMFKDNAYEKECANLINYSVRKLNELYDSVCIHAQDWSKVKTDLEFEDALVVNEVEFIAGEYPTPMIMTWDSPKAEIMTSIENVDGEDRIGCERKIAQIELDCRVRQNENLAFLANPFAYAWFDPNSKAIKFMTYNETAQAIWLLNQIQPKGKFYMYANYDFNEIPQLKVVNQNIVLVKIYKNSKSVIHNVKFIDL